MKLHSLSGGGNTNNSLTLNITKIRWRTRDGSKPRDDEIRCGLFSSIANYLNIQCQVDRLLISPVPNPQTPKPVRATTKRYNTEGIGCNGLLTKGTSTLSAIGRMIHPVTTVRHSPGVHPVPEFAGAGVGCSPPDHQAATPKDGGHGAEVRSGQKGTFLL